jgi:hypothetical protein
MDKITGDHIAKPGSQSVIGRTLDVLLFRHWAQSVIDILCVRACAFQTHVCIFGAQSFLGFGMAELTGYDNNNNRRLDSMVGYTVIDSSSATI